MLPPEHLGVVSPDIKTAIGADFSVRVVDDSNFYTSISHAQMKKNAFELQKKLKIENEERISIERRSF